MPRTVGPFWSSFKPWIPPARTARSNTLCQASIHRAVTSVRSSARAMRRMITIISGGRPSACQSGAASASSIDLTTRKCSSCACTGMGWSARSCPQSLVDKAVWKNRFKDIRAYERYLIRNGTLALKFYLHLSKDEQRRRFCERLDNPSKNWKFSFADLIERQHWDKYMVAYEDMIANTSMSKAPWYMVPADNKWFTRMVVVAAIVEALEDLDLSFPRPQLLSRIAAARAVVPKHRRRAGEGNGSRTRTLRP